MAKPFLLPTVTLRRVTNLSLDDVAKRLHGEPNLVRIGLPDAVTTEKSEDERRRRSRERKRRR